jgi:hypothetical protein
MGLLINGLGRDLFCFDILQYIFVHFYLFVGIVQLFLFALKVSGRSRLNSLYRSPNFQFLFVDLFGELLILPFEGFYQLAIYQGQFFDSALSTWKRALLLFLVFFLDFRQADNSERSKFRLFFPISLDTDLHEQ